MCQNNLSGYNPYNMGISLYDCSLGAWFSATVRSFRIASLPSRNDLPYFGKKDYLSCRLSYTPFILPINQSPYVLSKKKRYAEETTLTWPSCAAHLSCLLKSWLQVNNDIEYATFKSFSWNIINHLIGETIYNLQCHRLSWKNITITT